METDKQLNNLFKANPAMLKEFLDLDGEGKAVMRSEVLKALERRIDGVYEPASGPVTIVEFQGYPKENIYALTFAAMALYDIQHPGCGVHGVILFLNPEDDPGPYPWKVIANAGFSFFKVLYFKDVLDALRQRDPDHPLLLVFFPLI